MLVIVIPMAGLGSRFTQAGYAHPKPLISIHGVPMIRLIIENIRPSRPHRFVFICQRSHVRDYDLVSHLRAWAPGAAIVELDGVTEGAACTVLAARDYLPDGAPMMIANSDQYIDIGIDQYLDDMDQRQLDGLIMTMDARDNKWSYASVNECGMVTRVVEKQVISRHATVGIYNFRRVADFVRAAESMIAQNLRVNNEFYVAPVYNQMIASGARVGIHTIGSDGHVMHGLGTPTDLEAFLALPLSRRVAARLP